MSGSFKIALVGAGGIANAHLNAARSSGGMVEVSAVIDPVGEARAKLADAAGGAPAFPSIEAFFADGANTQAVVVCTPPSVRIGIIEAALARGLHVLAEKPLAHTLADAKKLLTISQRHPSLTTAVAYCHRFTPAVLAMKDLIAAGKIGTLLRFENAFACDLPGHKTKWFSDPGAAGGGAFIDMGCHSLDLYHFMVGPSRVAGSLYAHVWPGRTETAATVLVRNTAGSANIPVNTAGLIISGWSESSRFTVAAVGSAGTLFYDYEKPTELVFKDLVGKPESHPIEEHGVRFTRQLQAFAKAAQGGPRAGLATFAEGVLAAESVEAAEFLARV